MEIYIRDGNKPTRYINHWWFKKVTKEIKKIGTRRCKDKVSTGVGNSNPDQVTILRPPIQGKFRVLIRKTMWTDLTPQHRPFRHTYYNK